MECYEVYRTILSIGTRQQIPSMPLIWRPWISMAWSSYNRSHWNPRGPHWCAAIESMEILIAFIGLPTIQYNPYQALALLLSLPVWSNNLHSHAPTCCWANLLRRIARFSYANFPQKNLILSATINSIPLQRFGFKSVSDNILAWSDIL